MKSLLAASALAGIAMLAAPASAQVAAEEASDDVRMSIVYGDDAAPACPEGEICVVARSP